ncbi:MAG: adenylosuccinate synthase [Eubacteriaceae bacterium]|nr:adenylosuccinate synthase [Eubacteriaceae bacterium]
MPSLAVIGMQWGDEGKGKITDCLTERSDVVVRYQGGNNAGHTVIADGVTYKLHLVPSGVIQNKTSVIGAGVAFDPIWFEEEALGLQSRGVGLDRLHVDLRAHLILPYHIALDELSEKSLGNKDIGTTLRGIGPCYADKAKRIGIRVCDLLEKDAFAQKLEAGLSAANDQITKIYGGEPLRFSDIYERCLAAAEFLRPFAADCSVLVFNAIKEGKKTLFEGAQGTLLDLDFGTYPYVTSSHPTASGALIGTGIGPAMLESVVGVAKAYTTRVGKGPFPTELIGEKGDWLREQGAEYGTTTGRPRRCGWLDAEILKFAVRINSVTSIALTKLDTLTGMDSVKICTGYRLGGRMVESFPADLDALEKCEPVYEEMGGWTEDISGARSIGDLPKAAIAYIKRVEELSGIPVGIVSVGADREETVINGRFFFE